MKKFFKKSIDLLQCSFAAFSNDRALKLSASLAYYTIFSIAPLLITLISLASIFYGQDAAQGKVFEEIKGFVGNEAALQIQNMLTQSAVKGNSFFAVTVGIVTLLLGATGVFIEIQDSLNYIWRVKAKPKKGWVKMLVNRLLSFSMIASLGFLLIASLIINVIVDALFDRIEVYFPDVSILVYIFNIALTFIIISILFGVIFKFLPDVQIRFKDVRSGAFFTAVLFMIGRFLISLYIEKIGPGSAYGAAGSLIVILVWVYYTSAILYFGAEFTQVYSEKYGEHIRPAPYAVHIIQTEEEKEVSVLPSQGHKEPPKE